MSRTIRFQFRPSAKSDSRQSVVAQLIASGAQGVEPLFPGEGDPELAALFSAHVSDDDSVAPLLALLSEDASVAFAEEDAPRRLVVPPTAEPKRGAIRKGKRRA